MSKIVQKVWRLVPPENLEEGEEYRFSPTAIKDTADELDLPILYRVGRSAYYQDQIDQVFFTRKKHAIKVAEHIGCSDDDEYSLPIETELTFVEID